MKKYTLCLLALPRTGTTSLWFAYGRHPEISRTRQKEPLFGFSELNKDKYVESSYFITDKTKILLDGTVAILIYSPEIIYKLKTIPEVDRICCIYTTRDPIRRIRSNVYNYLRNYLKFRIPKPSFLNNDNTVNEQELKNFIMFLLDEDRIITKLYEILGQNNVIIIKTDDMFKREVQEKVFNFLEISKFFIRGPILNTSNRLTPTMPQIKIYSDIMSWINKNNQEIINLSEKNKQNLSKKYGVEFND